MHPILQSPPGPAVTIDGRRFNYFAGTAYLALQGHPEVILAGCEALRQYGVHSATSRGGYGNQPPTLKVERLAGEFFGAEAAFYFISGYLGNNILCRALAPRFDAAFVDEHAHYSVFEGLDSTGWTATRFRHRDPDDLCAQLRSNLRPGQRPIVLSDGVFPVSGQIAPVAEYLSVLAEYDGSALCLDDAHAVAVLGGHGRGTFEHAGRPPEQINQRQGGPSPAGSHRASAHVQLFCCGTLSKAVGGSGGIIAGSHSFIEDLKSSSRYFDAASPPAAPVAAATAAALSIVVSEPERRAQLRDNALLIKRGLRALGLDVDQSPTPIAGLVIGSAENMRRIQGTLFERGWAISYMPSYSGVGTQGVLRLAVCSEHEPAMIESLLEELASAL